MNTAKQMTTGHTSSAPDQVPTLVVGLGATGLSCVRFLSQHNVPVAVTDSRRDPPGMRSLLSEFKNVRIAVGGFDENLFAWAKRLLVSPGVSLQEPMIKAAMERGVQVIGDVELFAQLVQAPVVAITGSNGKSTVTSLMGRLINDAGQHALVGGNIGRPVLELLDNPVPDYYVLELSSFQLESTYSLNPVVSVVLNLSADHMDRYADIAAYAAAKASIYRGDGVQIINRNDPAVLAMADPERRQVSFGLDAPDEDDFGRLNRDDQLWLVQGRKFLMPVEELRMAGEHNQANALAALAIGWVIGLPMPAMLQTLRQFSGLPHRTQWVAEVSQVNWYNDSKGTNVGATISAIRGLQEPLVLIAGGQGKGADFSPLREAIQKKVHSVVLIGEDAQLIAKALQGVTKIVFAHDMEDAVGKAAAMARPGDSVLLSPACASFDMYTGYEARGEAFISAVHGLAGGGQS